MKNSTLAFVVLLLVGALIGGILFTSQKKEVAMEQAAMEQESMAADTEAMMEEDAAMEKESMTKSEQYIAYSPEQFVAAVDKRRVLFFYANWCPTCVPADEDFQENINSLPKDVVVLRVNYNDSDTDEAENALVEEYGVTYQHTYVQIDAQGNKVAVWNGGKVAELLENLQ